jgi:hypothetical protein
VRLPKSNGLGNTKAAAGISRISALCSQHNGNTFNMLVIII